MEWLYPKRRGPEWKQGWTGQTLASISTPPLPLLTISGIVIFLLWLSQYTDYKAQLHLTAINFQIFLFLLPLLLILLIASYASNWMLYFGLRHPRKDSVHPVEGRASSSPWGMAIFVLVLVMLLSYQSSFHSKWFGPLWRSN